MAEVPVLRLEGLTKFFGERAALDNVSFSVNSGEYVSLLGPSGSGKTVLLRAIAGFETLQGGRVLLKGEDITSRPPYLRGVGFVFQNFALFPHLSVFDNVAFGLRNGARPALEREARARTLEMLEAVGLAGQSHQRPNELSGGQRQRVAIARALVKEPQVVLADEPTANLDSATGASIIELMRRVQVQSRTTFIFATHDPQLMSHADEIFVIRDGELVEQRRGDRR